ncbi:MAG: UDP-N-acetylmuramoyl-L-alanine--D-glutamate ligase [Clostridia bacterium]|nr:UDP-N-acetylmuramoyl-L-alanine--D-glutamate ligase [Clostridia bacterium]
MFNPNYEMFKSMIMGKRVAVLGLGISNIPAIEFLAERGALIIGCDKKPEDKFDARALETIKKYSIELHLGDDYLDHLESADIVIKSPGIKVSEPQIQKAISDGKTVTSEIEIFMSLCPCRVIGVTGSDGKTTTTTLIYEMLKQEGYRVHVGGNIGKPLLAQLESIYEEDVVVLELSSFQLQTMHLSPEISVVTNISPNHLDYHVDMQEYIDAKANVFNFHKENSKLVVNADCEITKAFADNYKYKTDLFSRQIKTEGAYLENGFICYRGEKVLDVSRIKIKGWHNVENYMAAICALDGIVSFESVNHVAVNFGGVEHRMEFVRSLEGVDFYNDSIGSSPTRTIAGLNAQPPGKIVLIAGGYDKKLAFGTLADKIIERVDILVLMGATASQIDEEVKKASCGIREVPTIIAKDMQMAVKSAFAAAKGIADNGRVSVILSPACASFDMYRNFEERGNDFKNIVNNNL